MIVANFLHSDYIVDWPKYGHVIASEYRKKIVSALTKGPKTPKQIADETELYLSHVSHTIKGLMKREIVECLTPQLRRGKIFKLTEDGQEIAEQLSKLG